jgi:hypothetical protein
LVVADIRDFFAIVRPGQVAVDRRDSVTSGIEFKEESMRKFVVFLLVAVVAGFATGCGKGPAEAALKAADDAVAAAKPDAEKYVPEQYKALTEAVTAAKAKFEAGDYAAVTESLKDVPTKAAEVTKAAAAKKEELAAAWKGIADTLPAAVDGVKAKIEEIVKTKKMPKGMDKDKLAALQTDLTAVSQGWTEASAAFQGGDVMGAIEKAKAVKAKADGLVASLAPPEPAAAKAAEKKQ